MCKKIAIIGSGVSGLTAAYLLYKDHDITVLEVANRIGGHTASKEIVFKQTEYTLDTAFIVFNNETYPNFNCILKEFGIQKQTTEMGFGVRNDIWNLEYNTSTFFGFFAQKRNLFSISHWLFLLEILRFNKLAKTYKDKVDIHETVGVFIERYGFSQRFIQNYILPLTAIVWSQPIHTVSNIPLRFFLQFFNNHGLFSKRDILQWYVVKPNSSAYLEPLVKPFKDKIRLNIIIKNIQKYNNKLRVVYDDGSAELFDDVIFSTPAPVAASVLDSAFAAKEVISRISFTSHVVSLHTDSSVLPASKDAWEAWNICIEQHSKQPIFTYNMNELQSIQAPVHFLVTLDGEKMIDPGKILYQITYSHPKYDNSLITVQNDWRHINGKGGLHFCGAYWRNGFHEDGVWSGIRVAKQFGVDLGIFKDTYSEV